MVTQTEEFDTFTFSVSPSSAELHEYVGAANNANGQVVMGFVKIVATGTTMPQYNFIDKETCHKVLFWKKCSHHIVKEVNIVCACRGVFVCADI